MLILIIFYGNIICLLDSVFQCYFWPKKISDYQTIIKFFSFIDLWVCWNLSSIGSVKLATEVEKILFMLVVVCCFFSRSDIFLSCFNYNYVLIWLHNGIILNKVDKNSFKRNKYVCADLEVWTRCTSMERTITIRIVLRVFSHRSDWWVCFSRYTCIFIPLFHISWI